MGKILLCLWEGAQWVEKMIFLGEEHWENVHPWPWECLWHSVELLCVKGLEFGTISQNQGMLWVGRDLSR